MKVDDGVAQGLMRLGVAAAQVEKAQKLDASVPDARPDFEVHEDCWDSVMLFLAMQTQWVYVAGKFGREVVGLNYQALEAVMRLKAMARKRWPALFEDMRLMEDEVLGVQLGLNQTIGDV